MFQQIANTLAFFSGRREHDATELQLKSNLIILKNSNIRIQLNIKSDSQFGVARGGILVRLSLIFTPLNNDRASQQKTKIETGLLRETDAKR